MNERKRIFALGFFDGVHLGHQALLAACRKLANELGCAAAAVTFDTHPLTLVRGLAPGLLNTPEDRCRLLEQFGMNAVHTLPFDREMMNMPWRVFVETLLSMGAAGFVCGDDYRFGHRGEGDPEKLKAVCQELGLPCIIVPEQMVDGQRVSSTRIREKIELGEMEGAVKLLGHPHILTGKVIHGYQLGRTLGIPTANLMLPSGLAVPRFGVYACRCRIDGEYYLAVTNIGTRPTVAGIGVTVEPWILDYNGDLYGREITLEFHRFLRPEQKFTSLEVLRQEILRNAEETRAYFQTVR